MLSLISSSGNWHPVAGETAHWKINAAAAAAAAGSFKTTSRDGFICVFV